MDVWNYEVCMKCGVCDTVSFVNVGGVLHSV